MYLAFFRSPDAAADGGNVTTNAVADHAPVRHINTVPAKDADLANVGDSVATKWLTETWFTIKYKTQADFGTDVKRYDELLQQRTTAGGGTHGLSTDMPSWIKRPTMPFRM